MRHHDHAEGSPECWDKCGDPDTDPTRPAESGRVFLVWDTDQSGVFLDSIHASRTTADKRSEELKYGAWVDPEWWVEPAPIDGSQHVD